MVSETEEFAFVYPVLINEIEHIENARGRLNDFQLMLAVSRAKDSMAIVGWERRQIVNAILEKYAHIYRESCREEADVWVTTTFGFGLTGFRDKEKEIIVADFDEEENGEADEEQDQGAERRETDTSVECLGLQQLAGLIAVKEAELLRLYREFYRLSKGRA